MDMWTMRLRRTGPDRGQRNALPTAESFAQVRTHRLHKFVVAFVEVNDVLAQRYLVRTDHRRASLRAVLRSGPHRVSSEPERWLPNSSLTQTSPHRSLG